MGGEYCILSGRRKIMHRLAETEREGTRERERERERGPANK